MMQNKTFQRAVALPFLTSPKLLYVADSLVVCLVNLVTIHVILHFNGVKCSRSYQQRRGNMPDAGMTARLPAAYIQRLDGGLSRYLILFSN